MRSARVNFRRRLLLLRDGHADGQPCAEYEEERLEFEQYQVSVGPQVCAGDCDGDGRVTIDELVTLIDIGLSGALLGQCPAGDGNGDGELRIEDLVRAVAHALSACDG